MADINNLEDVQLLADRHWPGNPAKAEEWIRRYRARGDFFELIEIEFVDRWLALKDAANAEAAARTPEMVALRATLAAEQSARSAKYSVNIAVAALLVAIAAFAVSVWPDNKIMQPPASSPVHAQN